MIKQNNKNQTVYLGGGCFWCIEAVFSQIKGIVSVTPGYSGGNTKNPNYDEVCSGQTGHAEIVRVEFNTSKINILTIFSIFFEIHDPTSLNKQGPDYGTQYRSIILYTTKKQKEISEKYIKKIQQKYNKKIVTELKKFEVFYPAEPYHHNYYASNKNKPYCKFVILPKILKIEEKFARIKT